MAGLLTCPTCQGAVSSEAPSCPHCGHPMGKKMPEPKPHGGGGGQTVTILGAVVVGVGLVVAGFNPAGWLFVILGLAVAMVGFLAKTIERRG